MADIIPQSLHNRPGGTLQSREENEADSQGSHSVVANTFDGAAVGLRGGRRSVGAAGDGNPTTSRLGGRVNGNNSLGGFASVSDRGGS